MLTTSYTLSTTTELGFTEAAERVREELKTEGFGVLCEIDVQATLHEKLGVVGEEAIDGYLDERFDDPPEAEAHRLKAAKARRRYLEEECECLQPATR
jgi:hypothetical protein